MADDRERESYTKHIQRERETMYIHIHIHTHTHTIIEPPTATSAERKRERPIPRHRNQGRETQKKHTDAYTHPHTHTLSLSLRQTDSKRHAEQDSEIHEIRTTTNFFRCRPYSAKPPFSRALSGRPTENKITHNKEEQREQSRAERGPVFET
jgi:hypothetical protein